MYLSKRQRKRGLPERQFTLLSREVIRARCYTKGTYTKCYPFYSRIRRYTLYKKHNLSEGKHQWSDLKHYNHGLTLFFPTICIMKKIINPSKSSLDAFRHAITHYISGFVIIAFGSGKDLYFSPRVSFFLNKCSFSDILHS